MYLIYFEEEQRLLVVTRRCELRLRGVSNDAKDEERSHGFKRLWLY